MENEIPQVDLFNYNRRYFDENNSWSINYQSLPVIMSALKMDNTSSLNSSISQLSPQPSSSSSPSSSTLSLEPPNSVTFLSASVFSSSLVVEASTSVSSDPEQRNSPISSCSDDENESENSKFATKFNDSDNQIKHKFRELRSTRNPDSIMRINRRTITKPKKLIKEVKLTPNAIKKLYIDSGKKLTRFKPSNLETIFEEPLENNSNNHLKLLGKKKLKRSLSCSDGLNITKATIKNRRQKIKRIFGKRFALKKINLDEFKEKLNSSMEEWEDLNDNTNNF